MSHWIMGIFSVLLGLAGLFLAGAARDFGILAFGLALSLFAVLFCWWMIKTAYEQAAGDQVTAKRRGKAASGICRGGGGEEGGRLHDRKKHRTVLRPAPAHRRTSAARTKPARAAIATAASGLSRIAASSCTRPSAIALAASVLPASASTIVVARARISRAASPAAFMASAPSLFAARSMVAASRSSSSRSAADSEPREPLVSCVLRAVMPASLGRANDD